MTARKKIFLYSEWAILFWLYPLISYFDVFKVSKFLIFSVPVIYALIVYNIDKRGKPKAQKKSIKWKPFILRMLLVCTLIAGYAWFFHREYFLFLIREMPDIMIRILIFYPWVSALPQEFLYRQFYFSRYGDLFPKGWGAILINAAAFAFLHIIFDNITSLVMTFIAGILFAHAYLKTNSVLYPWLEHAIYGLAVYAFGLGLFFYEPIGG